MTVDYDIPEITVTLDNTLVEIGGNVNSVNGMTGDVVLGAEDVHALPEDTELFSGDYEDLTNKPELFSGDYNDLTNKPTIPVVPTVVSAFTNDAGYVTSSYHDSTKQDVLTAGDNITITNNVISASSEVESVNGKTGDVVLNYTDVGALSEDTELFSGDYDDLTNKPNIPTATSDLTNDSGFITEADVPKNTIVLPWVYTEIFTDDEVATVEYVYAHLDECVCLMPMNISQTYTAYAPVTVTKNGNSLHFDYFDIEHNKVRQPGAVFNASGHMIYRWYSQSEDSEKDIQLALKAGKNISISAKNTISAISEVESVNGKTGAVVLDHTDVGALSEDTELFSGDYNDLTNKPDIPIFRAIYGQTTYSELQQNIQANKFVYCYYNSGMFTLTKVMSDKVMFSRTGWLQEGSTIPVMSYCYCKNDDTWSNSFIQLQTNS